MQTPYCFSKIRWGGVKGVYVKGEGIYKEWAYI